MKLLARSIKNKKMKTQVVFLLTMFILQCSLYSQKYIVAEFKDADLNVDSRHLKELGDGNLIITAAKRCYTPGAIDVSGCPRGRYLINLSTQGDTSWTSNLQLSHNSIHEDYYEYADGTYSFLTSHRVGNDCNNVYHDLMRRTHMYFINEFGAIIDTLRLNVDCDFQMFDYSKNRSDDVFAIAKFETYNPDSSYSLIQKINENRSLGDQFLLPQNIKYYNIVHDQSDDIFFLGSDYQNDSMVIGSMDSLGALIYLNSYFPQRLSSWVKNPIVTLSNNLLVPIRRRDTINTSKTWTELLAVDFQGNLLWQKSFEGDFMGAITQRKSGEILFAYSNFVDTMSYKHSNIVLEELNESGELLRKTEYDINGGHDTPKSIIETSDKEVYILANSNCCNFDTIIGPSKMYLLLDTVGLMSNVELLKNKEIDVTIHPNPASDRVQLRTDYNHEYYNISIYNIYGDIFYEGVVYSEMSIDLSDLTNGMYIVLLESNLGKKGATKLIIAN